MSKFTFVCPRSRPDENGAHDITDVLRAEGDTDVRLFCRRCGQVADWSEQAAEQARDPDQP